MNINLFNLMLSGLTAQQKAGWGLNGLVIGLGSVFSILVILIVVINLLKLSSNGGRNGKSKKIKKTSVSSEKVPVEDTEDENEIIAAITAAINCMAQREGKRFAIKSYKRIGSRAKRSY